MQSKIAMTLSTLAYLFCFSAASAQVFETPNGNPTGPYVEVGNNPAGGYFNSWLEPSEATALSSQYQIGLAEALQLVAGGQSWNLQYQYLSGQFSLGTYESWAS
ncbi:MAG TPA: hypothetical protein VKU02_33450 [Gemmataceae bacterium]|nr:hypothetical protein [Gemmataceae bacterium]